MRFSSAYFDLHRAELQKIDTYEALTRYLDAAGLEQQFLSFAKTKDALVPTADEWQVERYYMLAQVRALIGRYSKLGDNAFYHIYLDIDDVYKAAMESL